MKKVKGIKEREAKAEEQKLRAKMAGENDKENQDSQQSEGSKNVLGDEGDEDIIF